MAFVTTSDLLPLLHGRFYRHKLPFRLECFERLSRASIVVFIVSIRSLTSGVKHPESHTIHDLHALHARLHPYNSPPLITTPVW